MLSDPRLAYPIGASALVVFRLQDEHDDEPGDDFDEDDELDEDEGDEEEGEDEEWQVAPPRF